jgi:hypothetical protein
MSFISGAKGLESVLPVAHRTLFGAPGQAPNVLATLGFLLGALRYNSPDMSGEPMEQRLPSDNGRLQK